MTNQNNAAQAANKEIREAFELTYSADADDPACSADLLHFTNGWRACIMSQVRAPVAEPAVVGWRDPDCGRMAQKGPPHGWHRYSEALMTVAEHRALMDAALASAPVAPQACPTDVCQAGKADGVLCANDECDRANGVRPASAPVAGEQIIAWDVQDTGLGRRYTTYNPKFAEDLMNLGENVRPLVYASALPPANAAPQASAEDVRNAALEEAAAICDSVDNHANPMTARDYADAIRALKTQADKDGGQQRNWVSDWSAAIKSLPMGRSAAAVDKSPNLQGSSVDKSTELQGDNGGGQQRAGDVSAEAHKAALLKVERVGIELAARLHEAAMSLETISQIAGRPGKDMETMDDVRGYAHSRARAARAALSAPQAEQGERDA